jgi:hypothetical protein
VTKSGTASVTVTSSTNLAPTVASAAKANGTSPATVTSTSAALTVLGADDHGEAALVYTWTATGPAAVAFSANGTNAAKNSTATFTKPGIYVLKATIKDAGNLAVASSVTVTVKQVAATVTVSPTSANLAKHATQLFTASAKDQFGTVLATAITWSAAGNGTITTSGTFTAGSATSGATVTASATFGGVTKTASAAVTVYNTAPAVASALTVNPSPVIVGGSVTFSLGATDADSDALTYAWNFGDATSGTGNPVSHIYATTGAKTVSCTVSDGVASVTRTASVTVNPNGTLSISSLQVYINFVQANQDTCTVSGSIPSVPANFNPLGVTAKVDVGGANFTVTLDGTGTGMTTACKLVLTKSGNGYLFRATFNKGAWHANWTGENLTNAAASNSPRSLVVTLTLGGKVYTVTQTISYTANVYWGKGQ